MIANVNQHYDGLLAEHYDWMFGVPFETKVAEQRALLGEAGIKPDSLGSAIDLGCGSGFQTIALSELGYRVLAIDSSQKLIGALQERIKGRVIKAVCGDLRDLGSYADESSADAVVCMGDTLTHLPSRSDVVNLFQSVRRVLRPSGRFVMSYRDLAASELRGLDRFLPVRGDERRIMTCFLEYDGPDTVIVNDLIYIRSDSGAWELRKSAYRKLRLAAQWVCDELAAAGLSLVYQRSDRLSVLAAQKG